MTERERNMGTGMGAHESGETQDKLRQTTDAAREKADQLRGEMGHQMESVADKAGEQARSQLDAQRQRAVHSLGSLAEALRQTGQNLQQQNQGMLANVTNQAADRIDRLSSQLRSSDPQQMMGEVENFARRQPAIFFGGVFLAGFLGARFLKSSGAASQHSTEGSMRGGAYAQPQAGTGYQHGYTTARGEQTPGYGASSEAMGTSERAVGGAASFGASGQQHGSEYGSQRPSQGYARERSETMTEETPNYGPGTKSGPPDTNIRPTGQAGSHSDEETHKKPGAFPEEH